MGWGLSVTCGERSLSANPRGAREQRHGSTAEHTQHGAQQGHGAQQQPRATLQHQWHPQLLQGLHPKAAPKGKAGSIAEHHMEGEKNQESGQGTGQAKGKFLLSPCS